MKPEPKLVFQSQTLSVQSLYLLPVYEDHEPTLKQRAKASISSKKTQKAEQELSILIPTVRVIGQTLPLTIGVSYDEDHSTTVFPPPVFLDKIKVSLIHTAHVRCASGSSWKTEDTIDQGEEDIFIRKNTFQSLQITNRIDIATLMGLRIPSRRSPFGPPLTPTFKSLSIHCKYGLKIQLSMECGKQKRCHEFKSTDLLLLAKDCSPHASLQSTSEAGPPVLSDDSNSLTGYAATTVSRKGKAG